MSPAKADAVIANQSETDDSRIFTVLFSILGA
jgi:hypothetical protein